MRQKPFLREKKSDKDFFNPETHNNKVEQCKVYDKDGNLVKVISAKEQIDNKWANMHIDPLNSSPHPSRDSLAKRKRGQQVNRSNRIINLKKFVLRTY